MVSRCNAILRTTSVRCTAWSNDDGDRCGRHGGISQAEARRRRVLFRNVRPGLYEYDEMAFLVRQMKNNSLRVFKTPDDNYDCFICLDSDVPKEDGYLLDCCSKSCCKLCLDTWLTSSKTCPHCRTKIK